MRKFPILFTLLTTMIASTLSSILVSNSFLPIEGYSYDEENPPVSLEVGASSTDYFEGDPLDYTNWSFTLYYQDGNYDSLAYNSPFISLSIAQGTNLLYTDTEITISFEDPSNFVYFAASSPVYLTINRKVVNFTKISGTTDFIYNTLFNFSDWIFELEYFNGDTENIYENDSFITFSPSSGTSVDHTYSVITVTYDNPSEPINYYFLEIGIEVESIVTDIYINFPGVNPIDGDVVDYSSWYFELIYSDGTPVIISYEGFTEISPMQGSIWSTSDNEVSVRYVDVTVTYGITVDMRELNYTIGTISAPFQDTYFVGEALDFTGFQAEVNETSYGNLELFELDDVNFYSYDVGTMEVPLYQGYELTELDLFTEIYFEINTGYFNYDSIDHGGFAFTVYPSPAYQMDFKTLGTLSTNVSSGSRQAMTFVDNWLVKANESTVLYSTSMVTQGLVIGDETFATEVSFLSSSIWGVGGAANGLPIIESIYLKAYSNDTQVEFFINGYSVGFNNLNTIAGDDWIVFAIDQTTLRVGHLEMRLLQINGDTPITLEELRIVSSNDGDPSLMDMLSFAKDIEDLDTCADQSSFLTTNQTDYDSYLGAFDTLFTDLKLLDLSTPDSNRDELRVTLGDKWAMMDSLHGEIEDFSFFRGLNQTPDTTQTLWLGWAFIVLLLTFFWKKRLLNNAD